MASQAQNIPSHCRAQHNAAHHHDRIASRDMTQHKQSHRIKWRDHHIKWHDMTCHVATNYSSSPHITSQPTTLLHLTPQGTWWHQNRSHHHHGTAEGSFTAKKWVWHRAGRSPCAHSIGNFFLCYIVLFPFETSFPGSPGNYLYMFDYFFGSIIIC